LRSGTKSSKRVEVGEFLLFTAVDDSAVFL
jgi:hypothetical protein